jgi:predicted nucleotidyltransferase
MEILLHPNDRAVIARIVAPVVKRGAATLKLFGSRARGDARRTSDIDIALVSAKPIPAAELATLREALEDSSVPFRVDLLDYARAPASLRAAIDREGITWPV